MPTPGHYPTAPAENSGDPAKSNRKIRAFDKEIYRRRHLIENFYCKLKQFRPSPHVMTRRRKLPRRIHLAAASSGSLGQALDPNFFCIRCQEIPSAA